MYSVGLSLFLLLARNASAQSDDEPDAAEETAAQEETVAQEEAAAQEETSDATTHSASSSSATVVYEAPTLCPSRDEFVQMILARNPELDLAQEKPERWAVVRIARSAAGFDGSFLLKGSDQGTRAREVTSPSCREVATALSVVTAIALEPAVDESLAEPLPPGSEAFGSDKTKGRPTAMQEESDAPHEPAKTGSPVEGSLKPLPENNEDILNTKESLARSPDWNRGVRLQRSVRVGDGELSLRRTIAIDGQTGATIGLFPDKPVARFDVSARTALFMKAPEGSPFLVGFMPRLRFSTMPVARYNIGDIQNMVTDTYLVSLGGCYSPYFNPRGAALLMCADYGGGVMTQAPMLRGDIEPPENQQERTVDIRGVTRVAITVEGEYNFTKVLHLAARVGLESHLTGRLDLYEAEDRISTRTGWVLGIATLGVGAHF